MGWSGGTDVFDDIAGVVLREPMPTREEILAAVIRALEEHDWDTQDESKYWEHPLAQEARKLARKNRRRS